MSAGSKTEAYTNTDIYRIIIVNDKPSNNSLRSEYTGLSKLTSSVKNDNKSDDYEMLSNVGSTSNPNCNRPLPEVVECNEDQPYDYITNLHEKESTTRIGIRPNSCSNCRIAAIVVSLSGLILLCTLVGVGFTLFKQAGQNHANAPTTKTELSLYLISVTTGSNIYDGTDASVFITLYGKYINSSEQQIGDSTKGHFFAGRSSGFTIESRSLGDLLSVNIRHDNISERSGWFLIGLTITDVQSKKMFVFRSYKWLSSRYGISTRIDVSTVIDITSQDILIQQHFGGSSFFKNYWDVLMFESGSATHHSEYWLGTEVIHQLTKHGGYALRIDMRDINGTRYWEQYNLFIVGSSSTNYSLQVGGFVGGNATTGIGGTMAVHNGLMFSTSDRDNDKSQEHCADASGGAWWYGERCYGAGAMLNMSPTSKFVFFSKVDRAVLLQWSRMRLIYK